MYMQKQLEPRRHQARLRLNFNLAMVRVYISPELVRLITDYIFEASEKFSL
eukprot:UN16760